MSQWVDNAWTTMIVGGIVFVLAFIPGLIWQYRKLGRVSATRMLGWAAVCIYFSGLFAYTLLPLPENSAAFCADNAAGHNFNPMAALDDVQRLTAGMSPVQALKSVVVLQLVFNVVLFVPFGVILRRYWGRGIIFTTIAGALTSLLIETSQYTGLFGVYPCAYRVADVDDLILNTLGALIGAIIAPALLFWMPQAQTLSAQKLSPRPVTVWRRWWGMALDFLAWNAVSLAIFLIAQLARYFFTDVTDTASIPLWQNLVGPIAATIAVFVLPAAGGRGSSFGQSIVWIAPKWLEPGVNKLTDGTMAKRVGRSLIMSSVLMLSSWADLLPEPARGVVNGVTGAVLLVAVVLVPFTRTKRSLSGLLSGAYFVDARDPRAGGVADDVPPLLSEPDLVDLGVWKSDERPEHVSRQR